MKKRLLKILMLLFLIGNLSFSEYVVKDGKVFYDGKEVQYVDIESFRILNDKIAADSQNIYFRGYRVIPPYSINFKNLVGIFSEERKEIKYDVKKIELIPSREKDRHFYFFKYNKKIYAVYGLGGESFSAIQDVDYDTFKELSGNFVKDKNKVYFVKISGEFCNYSGDYCQSFFLDMPEIKGIVPKNFKVIADDLNDNKIFIQNDGKLYFINKSSLHKVEYKFQELSQIDKKTFKPFDYKFIKDKDNVYYLYGSNEFVKFEEADAKTFESIGKSYAKDKNGIYYLSTSDYAKPIKINTDKNTFELIKFGDKYFDVIAVYAKDNKNIYCRGEILEGVDYKTFKVFKEKDENKNGKEVVKIRDKNHEYDEYCRVKDE